MKRLGLLFVFVFACLAGAWAAQSAVQEVNFGTTAGVIELKPSLKPYAAPVPLKADNSTWYSFGAVNYSARPATRVLHAGQPPGIGLSIIPHPMRPTMLQVVSTSPGVVVESSNAYGRKGYRVTLPPSSKVLLAVRMAGSHEPPSLLAWTEPSLAAHNREIAIFVAAVAGLIGAAAAIAGGLAVMTHHEAPRWAAAALAAMLLTRLAAAGLFDGSIVTSIGGPYGLTAMFGGLALAAGIRFVDLVVPLREVWPRYGIWLDRGVLTLLLLSALAYVGLPGTTFLTDFLLFAGTIAVFVYLTYRKRQGSKPANVLLPSAGLFAMVPVAIGFTALGGFGGASLVPDLAGGFAAAGAILLALAVTAGEGIAVIPWRHTPAPPPPRPAPPPPPAVPHAAIEAIGASRQGVFELDLSSGTAILSREAASLIGLEPQRLQHDLWTARIHRDDRPVYEQAIKEFGARSGLAFRLEFRVRAEDGRFPWLELRATMKGAEGKPAGRCVGLLADVTTRKEAEAELLDRTLRDPLTGLGNRVALMEELENLGGKLEGLVLAMLDIDRFKAIHASLGDAGGDAILALVARRLSERYAEVAQVFRIGGDGFALVLRNPQEAPEAAGAAMVKLCDAAYELDGRSVFAPVSAGLATGREARDSIDLIKNAELALIQAKRQGGGCAKLYSQELEAQAPKDTVALEADLHRALDGGEIEVFYQPIVRLKDRTVAGFEALLRWRHPAKGLVSPADFIPHSEETGIIVALGRLAQRRAAKDLAQWQRYFPLPAPLFVSVNLSRRQMQDPNLLQQISELLAGAGLKPGSFQLEITESAVAGDADTHAFMARLRELGAGLAIDDFGTGLSSLSQLAELPFDIVKIDKSFLNRHGGTEAESNGEVVLSSVISLAHELKRGVIVEGVETEEDARRLAELGCEFAQGFHFSEPLTAHDAMTYIARNFRPPRKN
jgi:diguanylate cyclase (GGDEF)-like protein/PAS domain S-box-containing protein